MRSASADAEGAEGLSFTQCIDGKVTSGDLSKEQADEVKKLYREYEQHYSRHGSADWASARAAEATIERKTGDLARKKRLTNLRILRTADINQRMQAHSHGLIAGANSVIVRDVWNEGGLSVDTSHRVIRGQLHAMMDKAIERMRPKGLGLFSDPASLRMWVRAIFGEKVSDPEVADMARMFRDTAEYAKQRANAAGMEIGDREDWRMPNPRHDDRAMREAGFQAWRDFIWDRLDRDRMQDFATGLPLSDEKLDALLAETYQAIVTGGWSRREPGGIGGKALANRRADHRFLTFKTADDWLAYNEAFGRRDIFETLMGHIDGMAQDIALLEVMGPNPTAMLRYMQDVLRKDAATSGKREPANAINHLGYFYDAAAGRLAGGQLSPVMSLFTNVRSLLTAAQLGSASIAAITGDMGTMRLAAKMSGLPVARVMGRYARLMNPANAADRVLATRLHLVAENALGVAHAQKRYTGEIIGAKWAAKIADVVLRASLLSPHTQSIKWAFGMELLGFLADQSTKRLDQLTPELAATLGRYGIDGAAWDAIRRSEKHPDGFLWPERMPDQASHDKLMQMVLEETAMAVPEADARVRGITTQGSRADSILGQAARSVAMYKSFPVAIISTHLYRGLAQRGGWKKGAYLAEFLVLTTALGALGMQLNSIVKGKDPQDPTDPETAAAFWGAAVLKGGGLGIFGDFLFSETNRFGGGLPETLAGPVASAAGDVLDLTFGNAARAIGGSKVNLGRDVVQFARNYAPGTNLWYSRLALQRTVFDQLELMADPKARQRLRDMERKTRKDYGQQFWWRPGALTPDRAPDLGALVGQ